MMIELNAVVDYDTKELLYMYFLTNEMNLSPNGILFDCEIK